MIHLAQERSAEITRHGEQDYPYECCGLLLGRFADGNLKRVDETYPISNAREETAKRTRFLIRPEELIQGERYAAKRGLDIVGFYHSHPDHPAIPSSYDLEHAWPVYSYIVVSVNDGRTEELRSWEMTHDRARFNEEEILSS